MPYGRLVVGAREVVEGVVHIAEDLTPNCALRGVLPANGVGWNELKENEIARPIGREECLEELLSFTQQKNVYINLSN